MELYYKPYLLEFKHPFGVSSNTRKETPVVFIRLKHEGLSGYGESCLPEYLGENTEQTISFFEKAKPLLKKTGSTFSLNELLEEIDTLSEVHNAAKAALDIALHDIAAKTQGKSFAAMMGYKKSVPKATSFTIGIDSEEVIIQKIKEAKEFEILKIKAGGPDDKALIELIRKHTNKPLYVDVNQGWNDKFFVLEMIHWMKEKGVVLVEQPMPVNMMEEMAWITQQSVLPIIADESVKRLKDLENLNGSFSGINIKLMKCTGLYEALGMIDYCRNNKLRILLGCMAESSCATSAMAQLMQFADYIDLDAPNLYKNDPFRGITYESGKVHLNDKVGIGVEPIKNLLDL
jgi:L-alanine-DL-glutamate epimerase-like enolase superfamily enzyme